MLLLLLSVIAEAACPASPAALSGALDQVEASFANMEADRFRAAMAEALGDAGCLDAHLDPTEAARLHRAVGLAAFLNADEPAARRAFAAARAADPAYVFPEGLLPVNHPVRALYEAAAQLAPAPVPIPAPARGALELDGAVSLSRPTGWPTLAVLVDAPGGAATRSAYVQPETPLFDYPTAPATPERSAAHRAGPNRPLLVGAVVGAVASGALYGAAKVANDRFWDPATPVEEVQGLQVRTNALVFGAIGTGVLALGAGLGAFTVGTP